MRRVALMVLLGLSTLGDTQASEKVGPASPKFRVYVGTYTGPRSQGIYLLDFYPASGILNPKGVAAETVNPSFLAIHPNHQFLYAANEVGDFLGKKTGSVSGFAIEPATGKLRLLNTQPSGGADPCYVLVDPTGKNLLVANYSGGSVEVLPIGTDGKLGDPSSVIQHQGSSTHNGRSTVPHAHSIDLDASGKLAIAADLGLDKLLLYKLDPDKGSLTPHETPFLPVATGAGPRHFVFHPNGKHAYAINELNSTVNAFEFDHAKGLLKTSQTLPTRASGSKPGNSTAEILIHPSGKFVYGSNRGDDNLAIYEVDPISGKLTLVGHQATGGKTPRSFGIDPTGQFLIAANQNSDSLVVFKIDETTGLLKQVGEPIAIPSPVCVKFLPITE